MPKPARYKRALPGILAAALLIFVLAIVWLALPKPPLLDGVAFSRRVTDRNGNVLHVALTPDQKYRIWTPLREISPSLIDATIRYEDKYFARHPGVNPIAALRSAVSLAHSGRAQAGASTITMQLARLRFGLRTRTLGGKVQQMWKAVQLERHYTKEEILEAYLNLAPYGRNIEGIGAASEIYFGKSAARLTDPEAIALSVIPQSPTRRALKIGHDNAFQVAAQERWHERTGRADSVELSSVSFRASALSRRGTLAPHFVRQVLRDLPRNTPPGRETRPTSVVTTLDLAAQRTLERRLTHYLAENRSRGIENAAAMLIDFHSMEVLAQVGSADFAKVVIQGQVDGTQRPRSPGSTLKPFIYALALEQGLIHPLTMLKDAPRTFGDYNPENYDRDFLGPIRASDALGRSRNIPAVTLASELAHPNLYEFLRSAAVPLVKKESFYGLSLPLGGAEITMENLVRLYAALANDGRLQELRRTANAPQLAAQRLLTPEAAFLTLEMLGQIPRPGMTSLEASSSARVFWKTGTSHGFRDAWSVAVFDRYVLAVWVGNFNGKRNPAFIGRTAAAPLLFQMVDSLRANRKELSSAHVPPAGANLKRVEFCSVSGDLPGRCCPHRTESWFIPGISPIKSCEVHREVLVDAATGLRVAQDDGRVGLKREIYEFWPSDLLALFEQAGVPRRLPPPFAPDVASELLAREGKVPRITSPSKELTMSLGSGASSSIPLRAETETGVRRIFWFADKTFVGACDAKEVLVWKATPGVYELVALDDHGRSGSRMVTLR